MNKRNEDYYTKLGIEIGLRTGVCPDRAKAEYWLREAYKVAGLTPPDRMEWADGPTEGLRRAQAMSGLTGWISPIWGQHDINWLAQAQYKREVEGDTTLDNTIPLRELAELVGWCWVFDGGAVLSERPLELHMRETSAEIQLQSEPALKLKVLHNPTGPAVLYGDGTKCYFLNGIAVPAWLIEEPYDIERVLKIENTEVRNEGIKLGGPDVIERTLKPEVLDRQVLSPGGEYTLYAVILNDQRRVYLKGVCPSDDRAFNEAVPPTCTTVNDALAFRNGLTAFIPPIEMT